MLGNDSLHLIWTHDLFYSSEVSASPLQKDPENNAPLVKRINGSSRRRPFQELPEAPKVTTFYN